MTLMNVPMIECYPISIVLKSCFRAVSKPLLGDVDDDDEGFDEDDINGGNAHGARCDGEEAGGRGGAVSETATATPTPKMLLRDGKIQWPVFQVRPTHP